MVTCNQYDFIEIACMFQLPVEITLKNGESHQGERLIPALICSDKNVCFLMLTANMWPFRLNNCS